MASSDALRGEPPPHTTPRPADLKDDRFLGDTPSPGRRFSRALTRFLVVAFIGVGCTLAWQSYGETAKQHRPKAGPQRPPPRKERGRLHNPSRDMLLLVGWQTYRDRFGNSKAEFARKLLEANRVLPRPYRMGSSIGQIVRRLNRLLSAGLTPERLQADILKRMG